MCSHLHRPSRLPSSLRSPTSSGLTWQACRWPRRRCRRLSSCPFACLVRSPASPFLLSSPDLTDSTPSDQHYCSTSPPLRSVYWQAQALARHSPFWPARNRQIIPRASAGLWSIVGPPLTSHPHPFAGKSRCHGSQQLDLYFRVLFRPCVQVARPERAVGNDCAQSAPPPPSPLPSSSCLSIFPLPLLSSSPLSKKTCEGPV